MDIGLKLKELRILKGLTQEELADPAVPGHDHGGFLHRSPG